MINTINVLDHGFVRLVDNMGSDLSIVRAARVSYDAAWRAGENEGSDHKLINYLWKNKHTTPFESCVFQFEVKAPIFVLRQWHRHRVWSFNELSARYKELPEEYYIPNPDVIGVQSQSSKQTRNIIELNEEILNTKKNQINLLKNHCKSSFILYRQLLNEGWPRELARSCLPINTYSHMFAKVDLLNLFKFLDLRMHSHAQYEIRVYAEAMLMLVNPIVPVAVAAWKEFSVLYK